MAISTGRPDADEGPFLLQERMLIQAVAVRLSRFIERIRAEEALAIERKRLANVIEGTNVGTWEWNVQTGETHINQRWAEMLGYSLDEIGPLSPDTLLKHTHPDDFQESWDQLDRHFRRELDRYQRESRLVRKDGGVIWALDRGQVLTWTEDGKPLIMSGTRQDITERKLAEEQIRHLATHDSLTDLTTLRLTRARRTKKAVAVIFVDLDGFKQINDTYHLRTRGRRRGAQGGGPEA